MLVTQDNSKPKRAGWEVRKWWVAGASTERSHFFALIFDYFSSRKSNKLEEDIKMKLSSKTIPQTPNSPSSPPTISSKQTIKSK